VLVRGDATRLPLADASVDAVTIAFGIRNVEDVDAACDEMRRVLKRGGRFAILEFSIPTAPFLRGAYLWYFRNILPLVGRVLSRDRAAYEYLPASVDAFRSPALLAHTLRCRGFQDVAAVPLTFGVVFLYTGRRS
jgi:demethylmenaquinone methyltransferase/2-methoxy-6-polyprenyl-1,4-benzoquinol methylase